MPENIKSRQLAGAAIEAGQDAVRNTVTEILADKRIAVTAAYHMNFSHEERTGTVVDLHSALEAGKIVGFQPRGLDGLWLLLPGQGTVECWMYSVGTGELTPTTFEWAQFYALPLYSVFSTAP